MSDFLASEWAPPMENGEVYFAEPWQGRLFGIAHSLVDQQVFTWDEFRDCLIDEISRWERTQTGEYHYFERFQCALENLLTSIERIDENTLTRRSEELAKLPHGHDH